MSAKEISRVEIIEKVLAKRLNQKSAAKVLSLSVRQMRRLVKCYQAHGAMGLLSKHRGKVSNRRYSEPFKEKILEIIKANYFDFGPTLASEKLLERHEVKISKETVRQWMMEAALWGGKKRQSVRVHQQRARRACVGELVQIDGSPHAWFEERAPKCCLLVYIDDATSQLLQLHFCEAETTNAYFQASKAYMKQYGRPVAFYSDKHGIFRINIPEAKSGTGESQFGRAMRELDVKLICANSPQAKGRVERANSTLQDRLVKELRLNNISDIDAANTFAPKFIEAFNQRFAKPPASPVDLHRKSLPTDDVLNLIFTHQCQRKLSKNLELSYKNKIYQIKYQGKGHRLRQSMITVCEDSHQLVTLLHKESLLDYAVFDKHNRPTPILSKKEIDGQLERNRGSSTKTHKPNPDHPWRRYQPKSQRARKVA